jgi:entericidin B
MAGYANVELLLKESFMKLTAFVLSILMALSLAACNTMEGVGEDMGAAGDAIDREAEESKNY